MAPAGGECARGLPIEECPDAVLAELDDAEFDDAELDDIPDDEGEVEKEDDFIPVATLDSALTTLQANPLFRQSGGHLAIIVGEAEAGKTTLVSELYGRFVESPGFAGHRFCGSVTVLALEERLHDSRVSSGRVLPTTIRTDEDLEGFLHLRLETEDGRHLELLFSDFPGELFREVREGTRRASTIPGLARADKLLVLVDGKRLATPETRELAVAHPQRLLNLLHQAGDLHETTEVAVVVAKWDLVEASPDALQYWEAKSPLVPTDFSGDPPREHRVAARPDSGPSTGLDALLRWLSAPPDKELRPRSRPPRARTSRWIDRQ